MTGMLTGTKISDSAEQRTAGSRAANGRVQQRGLLQQRPHPAPCPKAGSVCCKTWFGPDWPHSDFRPRLVFWERPNASLSSRKSFRARSTRRRICRSNSSALRRSLGRAIQQNWTPNGLIDLSGAEEVGHLLGRLLSSGRAPLHHHHGDLPKLYPPTLFRQRRQ